MTKHTLTETLPDLPDEFSIEELIERLLIVEKIEKGRRQYSEGRTLTSEEVSKRMQEWCNLNLQGLRRPYRFGRSMRILRQ